MTVFSSIRRAVLRADGAAIASAFSSSDQVALEMADLSNEVAEDIAKSHDWRDLTKVHIFSGDGVQTAFPKPAGYDRMVLDSTIDDGQNWLWGYHPIPTVNEWMRAQHDGWPTPGGWILLGGEFQFAPAPSGSASFPYQSRNWARSESGSPKSQFTSDDDTFVLDDRLLTLGLIWRWKSQKGLDYSEDMASYEMALQKEQARDKGARVIRETRPSRTSGVGYAYPWSLG